MSQLGQTEKSGRATGKSALASITDVVRAGRNVSKVPTTDSVQQITSLFDHLVGAGEQRRRHAEAERFSSLEVDYEIELLRPLYR
jgi:hypothetical protein